MKIFLAFIFFLLLSNCSFDNKSGIWTNNNNSDSKTNNEFKDFELLYSKTKTFDKLIDPKENLEIILDPIIENYKWVDENYRASNNIDNFYFKDKNKAAFKSKKLSKSKIKSKFLLENQNAVFTDTKGNIIIYSIKDQKIVLKYNFYKKNIKK